MKKNTAWLLTSIKGKNEFERIGALELTKGRKTLRILLTNTNLLSILDSLNDAQHHIAQQKNLKSEMDMEYSIENDAKEDAISSMPPELMAAIKNIFNVKSPKDMFIQPIVVSRNIESVEKEESNDAIYFVLKDIMVDGFDENIDLCYMTENIDMYFQFCGAILKYADSRFNGMIPNRFRITKKVLEGCINPSYIYCMTI